MNVSEEYKITTGKITGETLKIDLESSIIIDGKSYTSNEFNEAVEMLKQPQLNENQQNLIIWMKENECETNDPLESISDLFLNGTPSKYFPDLPLSCLEAAYQSLNNQQKMELVSEYLKQYSEQEE
ncbi:hypothetical protein ABVF54_14950 [Enterococcus mundtii]|uniref:Uncharacterized protein n=1 Tax=Enterococcus mundtii TaxID=53346 RepID=A0AAI8R9R7_ENTMU|nr:hypothetical protein [Enterococcus mundtii]BBM14981.1 uncharacterized protein EM151A_1789 [Enterococcus mundtii]